MTHGRDEAHAAAGALAARARELWYQNGEFAIDDITVPLLLFTSKTH